MRSSRVDMYTKTAASNAAVFVYRAEKDAIAASEERRRKKNFDLSIEMLTVPSERCRESLLSQPASDGTATGEACYQLREPPFPPRLPPPYPPPPFPPP